MTDDTTRPPDGVDEPGRVYHLVQPPPPEAMREKKQVQNATDLLRVLIQRVDLLRREIHEMRGNFDTIKFCFNDLDQQLGTHSTALNWLILAARNGTAVADATVSFSPPTRSPPDETNPSIGG